MAAGLHDESSVKGINVSARRVMKDSAETKCSGASGHDRQLPPLLQAMGNHKEAETLLRRVIEGREATLGRHHADTLSTLNSLALPLKAAAYKGVTPFLSRASKHAPRLSNMATMSKRPRPPA